jgi:hypothetical protein
MVILWLRLAFQGKDSKGKRHNEPLSFGRLFPPFLAKQKWGAPRHEQKRLGLNKHFYMLIIF